MSSKTQPNFENYFFKKKNFFLLWNLAKRIQLLYLTDYCKKLRGYMLNFYKTEDKKRNGY